LDKTLHQPGRKSPARPDLPRPSSGNGTPTGPMAPGQRPRRNRPER